MTQETAILLAQSKREREHDFHGSSTSIQERTRLRARGRENDRGGVARPEHGRDRIAPRIGMPIRIDRILALPEEGCVPRGLYVAATTGTQAPLTGVAGSL